MALTFPRTDIFSAAGMTTQSMQLVSRQELTSREANGSAQGRDFGSAVWLGTWATEELLNDDAVTFEAMLNSLDGVVNAFEAIDLRRPCPRLYRDGSAANGTLKSVNANNKQISLAGLNAAQVLSIGDYLSFTYGTNRALHQVMEEAMADAEGDTVEFEVRPHLRVGWEMATAVELRNPRGLFRLVPGSVDPRTSGKKTTITFQAGQYIA